MTREAARAKVTVWQAQTKAGISARGQRNGLQTTAAAKWRGWKTKNGTEPSFQHVSQWLMKLPLVTDSPRLHRLPTSWCAGRIARWWCHTPGRSPGQARGWRSSGGRTYERSEQVKAELALHNLKKKSMLTTWKDLFKQTRLTPTQSAAGNKQIYCSLWAAQRTGGFAKLQCGLCSFLQSKQQVLVNRLYWISFRLEFSCIAVRKEEIYSLR